MKLLKTFALVLVVALMLASCTSTRPFAATSNEVGSKMGEATVSYFLGAIPLGNDDLGVYRAAKEGGITKISTVDTKFQSLFFITKRTTIVSGE